MPYKVRKKDYTNSGRKNYYKKPWHFDTTKSDGKKKHLFGITGSIKQYGYSIDHSKVGRHIALGKAIKKEGARTVWGRLHTQVLFRKGKYKNRRGAPIFKADRNWVAKNYSWSRKK
jgi:hypothetical protein